ncbi:GTP-binding protein [Cupriavidus sp. CV2]|uniref:CobW family GTP-binding protein n=1 Tax=Cupriavidus ulmosensis TaxID=3065913 RepID=UPI00296B1EE3|nr:GTP-binding protein [Cupriavidus sp. CV2]MDW3682050.1 GTP-binding protein [Cupriavidus sp. CV2]
MTCAAIRPPIDLVVIGGYLGAGKTTLLNRVLTQPHGKKVAVLVNDFGDINIDARLIRGQKSDDVIELDNGCICCTIGGALVDALTRIDARVDRPDVLLIEASGVSDPLKIAQIGLLNRAFSLTAVLVLVDAIGIEATLADPYVGDMARRQIAGAGVIALTKLDLAGAEDQVAARARIAELAQTTLIVEAERGSIPLSLIFDACVAPRTRIREYQPQPFGRPDTLQIASFSVRLHGQFDKQRLKAFLKSLPGNVLRAKGIVRLAGNARAHACQVAARRVALSVCEQADVGDLSTMVFIGRFDAADETGLRAGLVDCLQGETGGSGVALRRARAVTSPQ